MTQTEIFLQQALAELLECPAQDVPIGRQFGELGMDSLIGMRLARKIQDHLGCELELECLLENPSVEMLAAHLAQRPKAPGTDVVAA